MSMPVIVFDLSEVLIRGILGIEEQLADSLKLNRNETLRLFGGENLYHYCRGAICEDDYLAAVIHTHPAASAHDLRRILRDNFAMFIPGTLELAENLRRRHRVVLVSDHGQEWVDHILSIHPWLRSWPERFFSFTHGRLKQDAETFTWLNQELGVRAANCLLIDDSATNVKNALAAG